MRLFVAIPLPPDVAEPAARLLPDDLPALKRVRPELLHVTLAFLGETPERLLPTVTRAVADAVSPMRAFAIDLGALGQFPKNGPPNTVWVAIDAGATEVARLGEAVRGALRRQKVPFDDTPFRPHITLARVRREAPAEERRRVALAVEGGTRLGLTFTADSAHVIQSVLSPRGPRYTSLERLPLGDKRPGMRP